MEKILLKRKLYRFLSIQKTWWRKSGTCYHHITMFSTFQACLASLWAASLPSLLTCLIEQSAKISWRLLVSSTRFPCRDENLNKSSLPWSSKDNQFLPWDFVSPYLHIIVILWRWQGVQLLLVHELRLTHYLLLE